MILPIYTFNHPVLRKKTELITDITDQLHTVIDNMFETMHNAEGIGLAANQIGVDGAFTVVDLSNHDDYPDFQPIALINPVIDAFSDDVEESEEGCLSLPQYKGMVKRPYEIQMRFLDRKGNEQKLTADGLLARCIQHEVDHLNGLYFFDRMSPVKRALSKAKLNRIESGDFSVSYPVFEEVEE